MLKLVRHTRVLIRSVLGVHLTLAVARRHPDPPDHPWDLLAARSLLARQQLCHRSRHHTLPGNLPIADC